MGRTHEISRKIVAAIWLVTGMTVLVQASLRSIQAASDRPNIVLIFVDDLGYGDLGCYGNRVIKTPNIDRLASEGQRWTSFYSAGSTCVPSRKGLMSGRHPERIARATHGLDGEQSVLLPAMLKRQGYATAILGKWHLAGYPKDFTTHPMHPLECGFDFHFGTPGSNDAPGPPKQTRAAFDRATYATWKIPLIRGREVFENPARQDLFTQRYTSEAVRWIHDQKDGPFFLYLAHNMPHVPIFASEEFQGKSDGGKYGDVVEELDWSVGQLVDALQAIDQRENTLIVFTSDNGPWSVFGPHGGSAAPLRGEKSTTWEGGMRVPGIFHWPGTIHPGVVDGIGVNLDLYATFASLTDGEEPTDRPGYISTDLSPVLLAGEESPRTQWLYHRRAFRSGNYKIHLATGQPTDPVNRARTAVTQHDPPLLFDLSQDISEGNNIAASHPDVVERLVREMQEFLPAE